MNKRASPHIGAIPRRRAAPYLLSLPVLLGGCTGHVDPSSSVGRSLSLVQAGVTVAVTMFMVTIIGRMAGEVLAIVARLAMLLLLAGTVVVVLFGLSLLTLYDLGAKLVTVFEAVLGTTTG